MPKALKAITTLSPLDLARRAREESDPRVRHRILAIRLIVLGKTVPEAADAVGLKPRQTRKWLHRFNAEGMDGLRDRPRPGQPKRLATEKEEAFKHRVRQDAMKADRICALRGKDIRRILREEFEAEYSLGGVYFLLHRLGFSSLAPRRRHPQADLKVQDRFKKGC